MPTPRPHSIEIPTSLSVVTALACFSALLLLNICPTTARAQYRFDHWTADNGLPQNSVRDARLKVAVIFLTMHKE
jgi:hypothetical protein